MSEATALKRQDFDKGFFIVESESCFYNTNERKAYKNFGGIKKCPERSFKFFRQGWHKL
jgi:hypothetical protein